MPKQQKKIQQLADAPDQHNYEYNPIENYGLNLLKGMGFSEERGIGHHKQNALSQPLVLKPRPKGLGLGATPEDQVQQQQQFSKRDYILIKSGDHAGMIGLIKKVKMNEERLTIELGISGTQIKLKFSEVEKISQEQYETRKAKLIKDVQQQKQEDKTIKKRRIKWVIPNIRCKVIYKTSPYYLKKVVINDLINQRQFQCILITDNGQKRYIRELSQKHLQTVIPKPDGIGLILVGQYKGQKVTILERKKDEEKIMVQLIDSLEIMDFGQNQISEYVQF